MPRGMGVGVQVPIPLNLRQYYLRDYTITTVHGRKRSGHVAKGRHAHHLHGHVRSERRAIDPWHHKGEASGRSRH